MAAQCRGCAKHSSLITKGKSSRGDTQRMCILQMPPLSEEVPVGEAREGD